MGGLHALAAALLFGAATPAVQRCGRDAGHFATAALLYTGVALSGAAAVGVARTRAPRAGGLRAQQAARVGLVAILGAVLAPAALAWGLRRSTGVAAALLLNLEAAFTVVLGAMVHREHVGRRVAIALVVMTTGSALVVVGAESIGPAEGLGLAAVALATLGWAADNTLSRPLADVDPGEVVAAKGGIGALLALAVAIASSERFPARAADTAGLVAAGLLGWGLSLRLYLMAQRRLGAGRTASVFAVAPFAGAAVARMLGQPIGGAATWAGGALLAVGVGLHLTEDHAHEHEHAALEHDHAHRHDDGHHDHVHDPMPDGEHSHPHEHRPVRHAHAHAPDLHHDHGHG